VQGKKWSDAKSEEFEPGKGVVVKWNCLRKQNHFFDALYYASAAGWYCGVRLPDEKPPVKTQRITLGSFVQGTRPDGRRGSTSTGGMDSRVSHGTFFANESNKTLARIIHWVPA
jgi:hypothetical protein